MLGCYCNKRFTHRDFLTYSESPIKLIMLINFMYAKCFQISRF